MTVKAAYSKPIAVTEDGTHLVVEAGDAANKAIRVNSISAALPSGASTAALQTTGNISQASIDGKLPAALDGSGYLKVHEQGTAAISAVSLPLPTGAAQEHATAGSPHSVELSDGAAFYTAAKTGQLPTALDGSGFLKTHEQGTATVGQSVATSLRMAGGDVAGTPTAGTVLAVQGIANGTVLPANVSQFGGGAVVTGTGAGGAGVPRVTISNDSSLAANQSVNVAQIAAAATVTVATGVQKVGIVDAANVNITQVAKGTQAANFIGTQDGKDSGRVNICWTVNGTAATATAEALLTITESRDGAATATFTSKVVTSGKRLRLTSISFSAELNTGTAISRNRIRIRFNTAGAATTGSPIQWVGETPSIVTTAKTTAVFVQEFPDGMEWLGDGTKQIGITWESPDWVSATTISTLFLSIFGFEY